jgi:hypothetical protein
VLPFAFSEEIEMRKKNKLVYGVGVNDADYLVRPRISGKMVTCQLYGVWKGMLERGYCSKLQAKYPSYIGCSVAPEWLSFMTFRAWMIGQDWQGRQLDKDLLIPGNRVYGPQTCVFVSAKLNSFTIDNAADRGEFPIGVSWYKRGEKFAARCRNPFTGRNEHLGYFTCPDAAHEAWRKRKHELSLQLAAEQTDPRLAAALATRYQDKQ